RAIDTSGASEGLPTYLKMIGEVRMGHPAAIEIGSGQAVLVSTGGMLPKNADAVAMVENTQQVDEFTIEVVRPVAPGENTLRVGDDIRAGEMLFPAGRWLRAQDIGGLAALGITQIDVFLRPRVSIISTGDEIVPPEDEPAPGQVRDINTYTLAALARQAGAIPLTQGIVRDNFSELSQAAKMALSDSEILIISAGSSVSTRDMTAQVIASLGKPGILVHGVSLRPGKPTILAAIDGKPVFGLPGNPVSAMVVFDLLVKPAIYKVGGCEYPPSQPMVSARLTHNIASTTGREDYVPVKLQEQDHQLLATPIFGESNLITTMIRADGMANVPLDKHGLNAGETVNVRLF
ncbi:MAG: gephyrin-like molybdotransferase Glp, partial [Dehalococcoidia bacterium]